jgi:5-methylcytosine-specific restriction enzyme A
LELFFHDVGLKGAERDFPKTVFGAIPLSLIEKNVPPHLRVRVSDELASLFPKGECNCWGVPGGAASIIKHLSVDDFMLLIRTTGGEGEIPALCAVKAFWKEPMLDLSLALWGSERFPFVFFFNTERITLTWTDLKQDLGYAPNFRPSGHVYRVREERLLSYGGAGGYVARLLHKPGFTYHPSPPPHRLLEDTPLTEFEEGKRLVSERSYFKRNPALVAQAKARYGYICQVCGFDFQRQYGTLGKEYIECHHLSPLSEREDAESVIGTSLDDVAVMCSNCHRMIHRARPALSVEALKAYVAQASTL